MLPPTVRHRKVWFLPRGRSRCLHLSRRLARLLPSYHRRTLRPHQAHTPLLQVHLRHMVMRPHMLPLHRNFPCRTGIKSHMRRRHGLLWRTPHRAPHRQQHYRASLSGEHVLNATTRSDVLLSDHTVCDAFPRVTRRCNSSCAL